MIFTFDIFGPIDERIFKNAFDKLVETTTILRLVVDETDVDNPHQRITDHVPNLEFIDLSKDSKVNIEDWIEEKNQINFDLLHESYFTALIKKSEDHFVWYINQHHIFTDAYCFQLFFNKLSGIYQALINGDTQKLTEDDAETYANSFKLEKSIKDDNVVDQNLRGKNNFSLYGSTFVNPHTTASDRTIFAINQETIDSIFESLAQYELRTIAANLDLLTYLITSLIITISKLSGDSESIGISNIFSERFSKKSKHLSKPLLEILNKNIEFSVNDQFTDVYQKVYAFLILRQSKVESGASTLPSIIINFFDLNFVDFNGFKIECNWRHCGHMDSHHFLRFHIFRYKSTDAYTLAFDVKSDHEKKRIGDNIATDYQRVINKLVQIKPKFPLNKLCILPENEIKEIHDQVQSIQDSKIDKKDYFINILQHQFASRPDEVALHHNEETVSYDLLNAKSAAVAHKINSLGLGANSKVIIYLPRSQNFVYSLVGILMTGAAFVPVPYNFPLERLKYISSDVNADFIIHAEENIDIGIKTLNIYSCFESNSQTSETIFAPSEQFYILYTSGSTGRPKGVPISQSSITNYLQSIAPKYLKENQSYHMPLFTSVGFDLTMTSILLPLYTGGSISIYDEVDGIDLAIRDVISDKLINCYKCTPSHLKLMEGLEVNNSIQSIIVGGENFTKKLADRLFDQYNSKISIFNEYGPTEATIGCIVYEYNADIYDDKVDLPIGIPLKNTFAFIANELGIPKPNGVIGELCVGGLGLSHKYINDPELTQNKYSSGNDYIPASFYRTGDYARINEAGDFEYFGRQDSQVKVGGIRIEIGEIEEVIETHQSISQCIVTLKKIGDSTAGDYTHCSKCGLPSNYPTADFDQNNVCGYCRNFETYKNKVEKYFKTEDDFKELFDSTINQSAEYDCIMLYSGGKDSSYALGKLVEKGYRVLAFTLDNGYISDHAKDNIQRIVNTLGVDHIFGSTPAMNDIFIDSLNTHCNVCNGCFKTIYNLSLKIAYDKNIPFIVTGLSRGQFFETKLSEEVFWKPMMDTSEIEETLFAARQAYHTVRDVTYEQTNGQFIEEQKVLDKVKIVDFYRYHDVTLENLYAYINTKLPWIRPEDTGRSTNCLINKVGIYIHKQQKGFSNYAFPYSWDVRTGHKTKEETIDEIEEYIDEVEVKKIIDEIGYEEDKSKGQLIAYYQGDSLDVNKIKSHVAEYLPDYMVPMKYVHVDHIPLSSSGKVDYKKLEQIQSTTNREVAKPTNEIEEVLLQIWEEVLRQNDLSIDDDFFELGGTSLDAIRIVSRLEKSIEYKLPVNFVFQFPSVQGLSAHIMEDMLSIIESNSEQ